MWVNSGESGLEIWGWDFGARHAFLQRGLTLVTPLIKAGCCAAAPECGEYLDGRDMLDVASRRGSALPCVQDRPYLLLRQSIPGSDPATIPSEYIVKLGQPGLQVDPAAGWKCRDLGWEADPIRADGEAQIADVDLPDGLVPNSRIWPAPQELRQSS